MSEHKQYLIIGIFVGITLFTLSLQGFMIVFKERKNKYYIAPVPALYVD